MTTFRRKRKDITSPMERRNYVREYKMKRGCIQCGSKDGTLTFAHRNPLTKRFNLGKIPLRVSLDEIKQEMGKCDILCMKCHREADRGLDHSMIQWGRPQLIGKNGQRNRKRSHAV